MEDRKAQAIVLKVVESLYNYWESGYRYPFETKERIGSEIDESVRKRFSKMKIPGGAKHLVHRIRKATAQGGEMVVLDDVWSDYFLLLYPDRSFEWPNLILRTEPSENHSFQISIKQIFQKLTNEEKAMAEHNQSYLRLEQEAIKIASNWNYSYMLPSDCLFKAYMFAVRSIFKEENIASNPEIVSAIRDKSDASPGIYWLGCIMPDAPFVHPAGQSTRFVQYYKSNGSICDSIGDLANLSFLKFTAPQDDLLAFVINEMSMSSQAYHHGIYMKLVNRFFYRRSFPVRRDRRIIGAVIDSDCLGRENILVGLESKLAKGRSSNCGVVGEQTPEWSWFQNVVSILRHDYYSKADVSLPDLHSKMKIIISSAGYTMLKHCFEMPQDINGFYRVSIPSPQKSISFDGDIVKSNTREGISQILDSVLSKEPYASYYSAARETVAKRVIDI